MPVSVEQIKAALPVLLAAVVPILGFLVTNGVPQNVAAIVVVVLAVLALIVWVVIGHGDAGLLRAVGAVKGATVTINTTVASPTAVDAANDPSPALAHVKPENPQ